MRYKIVFADPQGEVVLEAVCDFYETLEALARDVQYVAWHHYHAYEWIVSPEKHCYWRRITGPVLATSILDAAPAHAGVSRTGKSEDAAGDEFEPA